ncbi:hypothetical protein PSMK_31880 [Phycisphaera mikurensis NBRC 102666]|uniref:Uncharacterized protein n=2 Tax=Phycisphaera TaxID=666508 RepID=I0IJA9_PHYMF|nr:hypothetical protein PSMK_31880 [Phycisphaera mikurensis NBRC 102666]
MGDAELAGDRRGDQRGAAFEEEGDGAIGFGKEGVEVGEAIFKGDQNLGDFLFRRNRDPD